MRRCNHGQRGLPRVSGLAGMGVAIAATGLAAIGGCLAAGVHVARRMVLPRAIAAEPVRVLAVSMIEQDPSGAAAGAVSRPAGGDEGGAARPVGTVRLSAGDDSDLPGSWYSLLFDQRSEGGGQARLGAVQRRSPVGTDPHEAWVERELFGVDRGELRVGALGRITGWWYSDVSELDSRAERIEIPVSGGIAEAWVIPPVHPLDAAGANGEESETRWAVHVHGRGAAPEETLRGVRVAAQTGRTSLVITYRGDAGAPAARNGRYGFGAAEWRDVSAAIAEVVRRGATSITLFGWSMGGTACLLAADRSPHAAMIDGLVLDSPALNWRQLVVHHTALARAPRLFGWIGGWLLETGIVRSGVPGGIPLRELTPRAFAARLHVPTLIHCGPGDTFVPEGPARELAALRPDLVTLHRVPRGEHVRLWNVEPERWDGVTLAFLDRL